MDRANEQAIRTRAGHRCEYCHFPELFAEVPFHLDHVVAQQHGGQTQFDNLALACAFCIRFKGPNLSGVDPQTQRIELLFHPRRERWADHFHWNGALMIGRTPSGRATIQTLRLNRTDVLAVRELLMRERVYPLD